MCGLTEIERQEFHKEEPWIKYEEWLYHKAIHEFMKWNLRYPTEEEIESEKERIKND